MQFCDASFHNMVPIQRDLVKIYLHIFKCIAFYNYKPYNPTVKEGRILKVQKLVKKII